MVLGQDRQPMVGPVEAVRRGFRNYVRLDGRATRAEYWWWVLFIVLGGTVCSSVDDAIGVGSPGRGGVLLSTLFTLAIMLPTMTATVRRLHDIGKTGWWLMAWSVGAVAVWLGTAIAVIWILGATLGHGVRDPGGFIALVLVVSLALFAWWVFWMARQGESGENRFGPDPRT